jgi:hypothetical protein
VPSLAPVALIPAENNSFEIFPTPGVGKTWKKSGKNREKIFFPNFEIFSTAYHKTSLGMIFYRNKRSCEMHGFRVISP